ncbi:hypothetical protein BJX63DRAFT_442973 [Aspergillus granulosus]|uniref:2EXR domain-containing protein n=1 Tax=Aspergillus granulosus TaxID=176169 RepID=A0ABR4I1K3_9EURO
MSTTTTTKTQLTPTAPIPNSSSSSCSCNTFPLFPFLPLELRLQIWTLTLSSSLSKPRTVIITCHRAVHPIHGRYYAKTFSTSTETPPLLFVNHEARTEALRVYRPHFFQIPVVQIDVQHVDRLRSGSRMEGENEAREQRGDGDHLDAGGNEGQGYVHVQKPKSIYVAFDREILRLREDVLSYIPELELGLIEMMVVDVADVHYFGHFYLDIIRSMKKLRMLELVVGVTDSDRMLAGRGTGAGNGDGNREIGGIERWAEGGLRRLERDVELLKDEFREMRESDEVWDCPEVRIVMRDSGVVMGVIEEGRGSSMEEGVGIPA